MTSLIVDNLRNIKEQISQAAIRRGRPADEIKLVAVVKNIPTPKILEAIEAGVKNLGESKVQDARKKFEELPKDITWHFIGHLQTNKVKYIVKFVDLIHSVDSIKLAQEINRQAEKENKVQKVLVQVNVSGEETKFGLPADQLINFLKEAVKLRHIAVKGLMTIAPLVEDPEKIRLIFVGLRELAKKVAQVHIKGVEMKYLSMGMTNDFRIAIEEGSNLVRIGTGIFKDTEDSYGGNQRLERSVKSK